MSRISPQWSARQQHQMAYLAEFTVDFPHTPGATNVVTDALSRPSAPSMGTPKPPVPTSQIRPPSAAVKAPGRRAALRGPKSADESAARLPGHCRSGIESSRGSFPHTSSGTGHSGPLACRHRCTASGFRRPGCSTALLSRCGLNVSFHVYHRERI